MVVITVSVSGDSSRCAGAGDIGGVSRLGIWLNVSEAGLELDDAVVLCGAELLADVELLETKRPLKRGCATR